MKTTRAVIGILAALALQTTAALAVVFTSNTTIGYADVTYDGQDIVVNGCTLTVNGPHTFQSLILQQSAPKASVLTHSPAPSGEANNRLDLTITGDVTIQTGARIDVSGCGYVGTNMPGGAPRSYDDGGGGGHGGDGGFAFYGPSVEPGGAGGHGSIIQPADFGGSGGGTTQEGSPDSPGGGAVKLSIGGTLTVEGSLLANGTSAWINDQGGAAGGSLWIIANRIAGSGTISASGGVGEAGVHGGGGGGGRIALCYGTNDFAGTLTAQGGWGKQRGGAGTIYFKANSSSIGTVVVNNAGGGGASTPLVSPVAFSLTISNAGQAYHTAPLTLSSLRLGTNGVLYHFPTQSLSLTVQGDATIDLGGTLNGTGRGYPIGTNGGPGQGTHANTGDGTAGGGGYGGMGGYGFEGALAAGGASYGDILQPTDLGSAGGYGDSGPEVVPGGGAIRLTVGGMLTVDGQLSVNGDSAFKNDQGGGAGGSLWLTVGGLAGTGSISANGGVGEAAAHGGGGAGGRIAVYFASNSFAGTLTAYGGPGTQRGGAGTIYTKAGTESVGHLALHNGDGFGALTPLTSPENFHALIERGAIAQPIAPLTLATLTLATNGQVYGAEAASPLAIHVLGNALVTTNASLGANSTVTVDGDLAVDSGGVIHADAKGYASIASPGPGAGAGMGNSSNGGAHGGPGGISYLGGANSTPYDSMLEPADLGSRGGDDSYGRGGNGGGRLRLRVGGTFTVNGRVSAKGEKAPVNNAGGGAGGSIWINAQVLTGNGLLAADGGNGEAGDGGGGGGGRIAVYYDTSTFGGTVTAYGGGGYQRGGAGTIYLKSSTLPAGDLIVNQGGNAGVPTPLDTPTNFNLIIGNQGLVHSTAPLTLSSLRLQSGGTLTHPVAEGSVNLTLSGDLTIETNALLTANGRGYPVGEYHGPGAGLNGGSSGGGGAYGGNGGVGYAGDAGGVGGYGSIMEPVDYGSTGGGNLGSGPGGAGGGAIKLVIGGTLTVDGTLSANGNLAPNNNAGGGAGGSIWVSANALAGAGTISANGGDGEAGDGGGGSGGRIALYCLHDDFAGAVRAYGGGGRQYGGAGTIYRKASAETYGTALFDNQGRAGAMSPLRTPQLFNLTVAGNTVLYPELGEPLTVNRLEVSTAGRLTHLNGQKLRLNVLQDAWVQTNGLIQVNGLGYPVAGDNGPGHGKYDSDTGSGAGHGGGGGHNYAGVAGGVSYDAAGAPVEWGSAGGPGDNSGIWCPGGGVLQLNVFGALAVDGTIAANGSSAFSNDQGAGAGGSVWLNVGSLAGTGLITANGGNGDGGDSGGGGGGRIAIYHNGLAAFDTNHLQVAGGFGRQTGGLGTIYLGDSVANVVPVLLAVTPAGAVPHGVSAVEAIFDTAINASSFTPADVVVTTPSGVLPAAQIAVTELTPQVFRISFPMQMADGDYSIQIGPDLANTFGTTMATAQAGAFTIFIPRTLTYMAGTNTLSVAWPTIAGLKYMLQASPDLTAWTDVGGWVTGNGTPLQTTFATTNAPHYFFRLKVGN